MLFTKVPFLLPRSCTVQSSAWLSKAKCWRERPASSGKQSSAALDRPTDNRSPVRGTVFIWPSGHWINSSRDMGGPYLCTVVLHHYIPVGQSLPPDLLR